jgi:DNA-binding transcriptional MerR regulator
MPNELTLLTSGAVARLLNLPRWQLLYLIERGELPGPTLEVPGRRLFTEQDVERLRVALTAHVEADGVNVEGR